MYRYLEILVIFDHICSPECQKHFEAICHSEHGEPPSRFDSRGILLSHRVKSRASSIRLKKNEFPFKIYIGSKDSHRSSTLEFTTTIPAPPTKMEAFGKVLEKFG